MKKLLSIIILTLFFSGHTYADDSYEKAFKKALNNQVQTNLDSHLFHRIYER